MVLADGLKPVVLMLVVQVAQAGVNIFFKLAISSGVSLPILIAYRFLFSTAVMVPLAFLFNRGKKVKMTGITIFQGFLCGLFGGSLAYNLYSEGMALTSATFMSAVGNLLPAVTFIVGISVRLERLDLGTMAGKAKVFGTLMGIGGAMLFTFYKGFSIDFLKSNINLLPNTRSSHVALSTSHQVLGVCLAFAGCISYSIWIIIQAKMSETLPCQYTSTGLMSVMGFFQSTIYALCVEKDWTQWKLGWDIRLWTAAFSGTIGTALIVTLTAICARLKGPLFVAAFNPLMLVIVALAGALFLDEMLYLGSVLGAILIVCGLYVVIWGKCKELSGLVPSGESKTHKSLEIIVASANHGGSISG
ncbi:PREDICTED: WAT1-related protein At1g68170-like isoform X3 [Camelina sativa]|uniref:WAT1-related protein n=1 Tax=Camelina sativa TaxID=90675 RepID=A0ABM0YD00_CAMSA|nr:PREDICTED: WAT1-related protein At1g68170-like isoform X3 [Camelina sativa]